MKNTRIGKQPKNELFFCSEYNENDVLGYFIGKFSNIQSTVIELDSFEQAMFNKDNSIYIFREVMFNCSKIIFLDIENGTLQYLDYNKYLRGIISFDTKIIHYNDFVIVEEFEYKFN